jgi:hypothetical protein
LSGEQELWIRSHKPIFEQGKPRKVINPKLYDVLFRDAILPEFVVVVGHVLKCVQKLIAKRFLYIVLEPI